MPLERRERAAMIVVAISRGRIPEELTQDIPHDVVEAFKDDLERDEAMSLVDLLADVLCPPDFAA